MNVCKCLDLSLHCMMMENSTTAANQRTLLYVYSHLLQKDLDVLSEMTMERISRGAKSMRAKLKSYAKDQLPGGKYWDPPPNIDKILGQIEPSNDVCESILGLNDWLQTSMPSASQVLANWRSETLLKRKKNKTFEWLDALPPEKQATSFLWKKSKTTSGLQAEY